MPKQLLNISKTTFKKSKKRLFWHPKWSKWPSQRAYFWPKILILEVIYRPFELKIQLKFDLLRSKIMPKQLLNNSKPTFKKSKKRLFWPPKWSKWPSHRPKFWPKNTPTTTHHQIKVAVRRGEKFLTIKILRIFLLVGLSQDPKGEDLLWVSIMFESFKTMPKLLSNISKTTFKKSKKWLFWPLKLWKWPSQRAKFWS